MFGIGQGFGWGRALGILYVLFVAVGCSSGDTDLTNAVNTPPTILSVTATPDTVAFGERSTIVCRATDEEGDPLTYTWSVEVGDFFGSRSDSTIQWGPSDGLEGKVSLMVIAHDRARESLPATINLFVVGDTGSLVGTVTDRSTGLALPSVLVSVGERSTRTSVEGLYTLSTVPTGSHTFRASIEDYSPFERTVEIRDGQSTLNVSLTPATSIGTVLGRVTNSLGNPVEGATCRIGERTVSTDADGAYSFDDLLREPHILQVTRTGYVFSSQPVILETAELRADVVLDATTPTRPAAVTADKNGETITITWSASPEDTVTEYQVYQRVDNETTMAIPGARVESTNRQFTVTGEVNRRYRFRISAINFESEESTVSDASNMVVLTDLTPRVLIPAGPVVLGSTPDGWDGIDWGTEDHPANPVEVATFAIDASEVTNVQYRAYLYEARSIGAVSVDTDGERNGIYSGDVRLLNFNASKLRHDEDTGEFTIVPGFENHPIVGVSWFGAKAYAVHFGLRLPTEAEWEKAARGSSTESGSYPNSAVGYGTLYPWGNDAPELSRANFGNRTSGTLSVTSLEAGATNHWSAPIYHLAGNAWEWCEDWLAVYEDPHSPPTNGTLRVLRGGGWVDGQERLRNGARFAVDPTSGSTSTGFRCAADGR